MSMSPLRRVAILGESPLVEEYAALCHNKGFEVAIRLNPEYAHVKLPKGFRKIMKPARATEIALELTNVSLETKKANLIALDKALSPKSLILSTSVTVSAAEQSSWISRPGRLIGFGALPSLLANELVEIAPSFTTDPEALKGAQDFGKALGKTVAVVRDCVGLVLPRILCMLANEASFALMENVASGKDIDTAMTLGTNYPWGPVQWTERIGVRQVHAVMTALHRHFGEDRYRVAPLLRLAALRNAALGAM